MFFDAERTTDHKRLVRGEQLLLTRKYLRIRDRQHQLPWKILILPGRNPQEEIGAIHALMPKAYIVAADKDQEALKRATEAGADEVVEVDLSNFDVETVPSKYQTGKVTTKLLPPKQLLARAPFDLLSLDLCSNPCDQTRQIIFTSRQLVAKGGVEIVTMSYGRDVVEVWADKVKSWTEGFGFGCDRNEEWFKIMKESPLLVGRLLAMLGSLRDVVSVMLYRGASMPMVSSLMWNSHKVAREKVSFVKVGAGDFEITIAHDLPNPSLLYATPQERIESLRRSHAAIKASYTRAQRNAELA